MVRKTNDFGGSVFRDEVPQVSWMRRLDHPFTAEDHKIFVWGVVALESQLRPV
jgi:hypothetical protein